MNILENKFFRYLIASLPKVIGIFLYYFLPLLCAYTFFNQVLDYTFGIGVKSENLMKAIGSVNSDGFLLMTGAVVGLVASKGQSKKAVIGAVVSAFSLIMSSVVIGLTPEPFIWEILSTELRLTIAKAIICFGTSIFLVMYFCVLSVFHVSPEKNPV